MKKYLAFFLLSTLSSCSLNTKSPEFIFNPDQSHISVVSTKNNTITEVFEFEKFEASIDGKNNFELIIDMKSINSGIEIRDLRIKEALFQTDYFQTSEINLKLTEKQLTTGIHAVSFDLNAHGVSLLLKHQFKIYHTDKFLSITPFKPLILNTNHLGYGDGFKTLIELANLDSINSSVPIDFILHFSIE